MIDLRQGDCLELMKTIPDKSIDICISDPPYGLPNEESFELVEKSLIELKRITKMQIFILDWRNPITVKDKKFAELVWEYGWISGGRTKSNHFYPTHNTIHFMGEDLFNFDTKNGSIIKRQPGFSSPRQCSYAQKSGHPYEKPLKLMEYLVERCNGESFIDPFMGSGTTGVACVNTKRNFIGIELDANYFTIAKKRIEQTVKDCKQELNFEKACV